MEAQKQNTEIPIYELDYELVKTFENHLFKNELERGRYRKFNKIEINYITVSPDQKYVIAGYTSGYITIFDNETTEVVKSFKAHNGKVIHLEFYEPENKMLTCGADGKILIFNLNDFSFVKEISLPTMTKYSRFKDINFVLITNNMEKIYFGSDNACLYVCEKESNYKASIIVNPNDTYPPESFFLTSGIFSPDNKYVVYSSGYSIKFVNIETGKIDKKFGNTEYYINDLQFHPLNKNIIISWTEDGTITYWNAEKEEELISFLASLDEGYSHICFDKTGKLLASGNDGNNVNIWDSITKHHLAKIKNKFSMDEDQCGHKGVVKSLLFTKDNMLLTGSYDGTAKLWKLKKK